MKTFFFRYRSPHNAKVSEYLRKQIKGDKYTPKQVKSKHHELATLNHFAYPHNRGCT